MNVVSQKLVTLRCRATGKPTPTITWEFNNQRITIDGTKYTQSPAGSITNVAVGNLMVNIISIADEGTYKCISTNIHSSAFISTLVLVQGSPLIIIH